ncbi:MAG TPA: N-acetylmuramoyl-L-alanine amidase [Anaerovoracaceae bacterium]|nr:N-acetylmuramoyl-L-alanine amidase [Anaerovoracaceae bacterium]
MPRIFLSPSTQEYNHYINGGNEEYYMNLLTDALIPYLRASGIEFARSNPDDSVPEIIERSNAYPYDLHLALQTRETPDGYISPMLGIDVYFYTVNQPRGEQAAYITSQNLKNIYPIPELVSLVPDTTMLELRLTNAPAIMVELGYHDNIRDALWIESNIGAIARNIAQSITQFLNVQFVEPFENIYLPE